ncbi:MAG: glycosyltransferase [Flavobacteriaceae bacterium]
MNLSHSTILVAPLNWGLGHSTRCIPIINALIDRGAKVIIASDGVALGLLQKEFPELKSYELSSYRISYAKDGRLFKLKMILNAYKILWAMFKERQDVKRIVKAEKVTAIISDNRLGVFYRGLPNVFITHQLRVLSGSTTYISSKLHQQVFKKYDAVWVPDFESANNLTGRLGHLDKKPKNLVYLGPLSRFEKKEESLVYDLMVLLSGPEPQRTMLEEKLLTALEQYRGTALMVQGKIEPQQQKRELPLSEGTLTVVNYMQSVELMQAVRQSALILCRSGYTTVMDLAKLGKKAFFIPTPGQYEQVHIAERLDAQKVVPSCSQDDFSLEQLERVDDYSGLAQFSSEVDFDSVFSIF